MKWQRKAKRALIFALLFPDVVAAPFVVRNEQAAKTKTNQSSGKLGFGFWFYMVVYALLMIGMVVKAANSPHGITSVFTK